ncbi:MAG: PilZ domain-containing protein [Planctomycetota bacterium]
MTNSRRQYRSVPDSGLGVCAEVLGAGPTPHEGRVLDISGGGIRIAVTDELTQLPVLGKVCTVRLSANVLAVPIDAPAMVIQAEQTEAGEQTLGLQFLDWMGLAAEIPVGLATQFNLRRDPRLALDPSMPVGVTVRATDDSFQVVGVVCDVSRSGVGISVPVVAQVAMDRCNRCVVQFSLPGLARSLEFGCLIRHRSLDGETLRYGLWFDADASAHFGLQQALLGEYVEERIEAGLRNLKPV